MINCECVILHAHNNVDGMMYSYIATHICVYI
ncbi:hypothetical protein BAE44_0012289 [Dichanthelium oligosanthes]|uniref:Uncharacterized protein n=1 Tax=Dichanthelium oligosanthes TaxID=888268 RepID=A0A1E5VNQ4_9POAL|nr:hypothetical protein BAE44_0012289 [Dichanthelium oligosanthes]